MAGIRALSAVAMLLLVACVHDWNSVTIEASAGDAGGDAAIDASCSTCPGGCVVTATDSANCGACGNVCTAPEGATATCNAGACGFSCNTGLDRCGDRCSDTQTAINFCGLACVDCAALPHVNQSIVTCTHGNCALTGACATNYADCDGVAMTGCEADLTSPSTCGSCGNRCSGATPHCTADAVSGRFVCSI